MSQIILDFGSGNTCKNDLLTIRNMIDQLAEVDTQKHEVIIKWQLFRKAGENIPLNHLMFELAYEYATIKGYKTTASVFDIPSLHFLLKYHVPFVKIANNRSLDWLAGEVPRRIPVYVSYSDPLECIIDYGINYRTDYSIIPLACISKYPAKLKDYETPFGKSTLRCNVSDHTIGLDLFKKYQPAIWEKHYKLSDSTGLDAGPFAITPEELKEIL